MLTMHKESTVTGRFRYRRGTGLECEVTIAVTDAKGALIRTYTAWRVADVFDVELSRARA